MTFLRRLTPPLLYDVVRARRQSSQWRAYPDYAAALKDCAQHAYQRADVVKVVVAKNRAYRERVWRSRELDLSAVRTLAGLSLPVRSGELNVLDFGGAGGNHYSIARVALDPATRLRWHVVETPAMAAEAQALANDELRFFASIAAAAEALGRIDLVFSSGALFYCPAPLDLLRALVSLRASNLFITRTALNDGPDRLITVQHSTLALNGPGPLPPGFEDGPVSYPAIFESKAEFESVLAEVYDIRCVLSEDRNVFYCGKAPISMYGYLCKLR